MGTCTFPRIGSCGAGFSSSSRPPASLVHLNTDTLPKEASRRRVVWGKVMSVYDGDTITAAMDLGSGYEAVKCRMKGYDSPEMKPPLADPRREDTKQRAIEAREHLKAILGGKGAVRKFVATGRDKYGRLLVDCRVRDAWISEAMIRAGHGVPYDGGKKQVL